MPVDLVITSDRQALPEAGPAMGSTGGRWANAGRKLRNFNVAVRRSDITTWGGRRTKDMQNFMRRFQGGRYKDVMARALFGVDEWRNLRGVPGKNLILPFVGTTFGSYLSPGRDAIQSPSSLADLPGTLKFPFDYSPS